jgi:hypothetical protein
MFPASTKKRPILSENRERILGGNINPRQSQRKTLHTGAVPLVPLSHIVPTSPVKEGWENAHLARRAWRWVRLVPREKRSIRRRGTRAHGAFWKVSAATKRSNGCAISALFCWIYTVSICILYRHMGMQNAWSHFWNIARLQWTQLCNTLRLICRWVDCDRNVPHCRVMLGSNQKQRAIPIDTDSTGVHEESLNRS